MRSRSCDALIKLTRLIITHVHQSGLIAPRGWRLRVNLSEVVILTKSGIDVQYLCGQLYKHTLFSVLPHKSTYDMSRVSHSVKGLNGPNQSISTIPLLPTPDGKETTHLG